MDELVEPIFTITDNARDKILEVRAAEAEAESLALWVTGERSARTANASGSECSPGAMDAHSSESQLRCRGLGRTG